MTRLFFLFLSIFTATCTYAQPILEHDWWVPNNYVTAKLQQGDTLFMAGDFTHIGPSKPYGIGVNLTTGAADIPFAKPNGIVYASVADGSGGWYIGGDFTKVGNQSRNRIARINGDGTLHPWNAGADSTIKCLTLYNGVLYVGGWFGNIGGQVRSKLAAIDTFTAGATSWNPASNNIVNTIVGNGANILVGGEFTTIGGQTRSRLAALDIVTGAATSWAPAANNTVNTIMIDGSIVYVGGNFTAIDGNLRTRLAAIDATTGVLSSSFTPAANNTVYALAMRNGTIYVGGSFTNIAGQARQNLAALSSLGGLYTTFPATGGSVKVLHVAGDTLYLGGDYITSVNTLNGVFTTWDPKCSKDVYTISKSGQSVYIGGTFQSVGGVLRQNLAAFSVTTRKPLNWAPVVNGSVNALAYRNGILYIGGSFSTVGGQVRNRLAAIDVASAQPTAWNPNSAGASSAVGAIVIDGTTMYVAGTFQSIGGASRAGLAALNITTGLATSWNPAAAVVPFNLVSIGALAVHGNTVYVSGNFTTIGGQPRTKIAALDKTTGLATSWNPTPNDLPNNIIPANGQVYVSGYFTSIAGQPRNGIAVVDSATGVVTPFDPQISGSFSTAYTALHTTTFHNGKLYLGGNFTTVAGQPRSGLAAIDTSTGLLTPWAPGMNETTLRLQVFDNKLYSSGFYSQVEDSNLIAFNSVFNLAAGAYVSTPSDTACLGHPVTFTVSSPSSALSYQWRKNGVNVSGAVGSTWTVNSLANHDTVDCQVLTSSGTLISTIIVMNITNPVPVSVAISTPSVSTIAGAPATFTATPTNGGTYPVFQWKKNGVTVGTNMNTYTDNTLVTGDVISCDLTSSLGCVQAATVSSNAISMIVTPINVGTGLQNDWWITNGNVYAVHKYGSKVYIGGDFTYVGPNVPYLAQVNSTTGAAAGTSMPKADGLVYATIPDGNGGWYMGGYFTHVNGQPRDRLAHVSANGSVYPWNPAPDLPVSGLELHNGVLYVSGDFTSIAGQPRTYLAAFDASTGALTSWNPNPNVGGYVACMVGHGNKLYVGGYFTQIGGQNRNRAAALNVFTGQATSWDPNANGKILSIALSGPRIYIGGEFSTINVVTSQWCLAAVDSTNGLVQQPWYPQFNIGTVNKILPYNKRVYLAGDFNSSLNREVLKLDSVTGNIVMAFNPDLTTVSSWTPTPGVGWVNDIVVNSNGKLCVGGYFHKVNNQSHTYIAEIDTLGAVSSWDPSVNDAVKKLSSDGQNLLVLGEFNSVGGVYRNKLAALDTATGVATPWSADANGIVRALTSNAGVIYAGGEFTAVAGATRNYAAAIDTINGTVSPWDANVNGTVFAMAANSNTVYLGGSFSMIGTQVRQKIGAVNAATGAVTSWNPGASSTVRTMALDGTTLYIGGAFTGAGGPTRNRIAALSTASNNALSWNPNSNGEVYTIELSGGKIYVGGAFTAIGGQVRNKLACFNLGSNIPTSWDPNPDGNVLSLHKAGAGIYVGGGFHNIGTQSHTGIALLDTVSGLANTWNPGLSSAPTQFTSFNNKLIAGGWQQLMGNIPRPHLAVFSLLAPAVTVSTSSPVLCTGGSLTFTASVSNITTAIYQWRKNGINIAGANSSSMTTSSLAAYDIVDCIISDPATGNIVAVSTPFTVTISSVVSPSVSIGSNYSAACAGTSVTFTATPQNGGTAPMYQWLKNGVNVGANSNIYTDAALTSADVVSCTMTSSLPCVTNSLVTSNAISVTITAVVTPSVTIFASANYISAGTPVTFTATPVNGGTAPSYQWKKNGVNTGTGGASYTDNSLVNTDTITCVITSNAVCAIPDTAVSNSVIIYVNVTPAITIASSDTTICAGTSVSFTSLVSNAGSTPSYQWQVNGTQVSGATNNSFSTATLQNGDIVDCIVTATASGGISTASNAIVFTVSPVVVPAISVVASTGTICAGAAVTFTATETNGGATPSYQWLKNNLPVGSNSDTYVDNAMTSTDVIKCILTSAADCAIPVTATSSPVSIAVTAVVSPTVSITASANTIFAGTPVTFTAGITNGGSAPIYQWKKNGVPVGTNSATYTDNGLLNNDAITCELTNVDACAIPATTVSNIITIAVNDCGATLTASATVLCPTDSITLTATTAATIVTWQSSPMGTGVWTTISNMTGSTLGVDSLTVGMDYRFIVSCNGVTNDTSNDITITISSCIPGPISGGGTGAFINNVNFGTINSSSATSNPTATPFYTYYPIGTSVVPGASAQLSVTIGTAGVYNAATVGVWIDYNRNGNFENAEWTSAGTAASGSVATAIVNIPLSALIGTTIMRVRSVASGIPLGNGDAYTTTGSGETEDYLIYVIPAPAIVNNSAANQTICANSQPAILAPAIAGGGTGQYQYVWLESASGAAGTYSLAAGVNNLSTFQPPLLTSTTWYKRVVISGNATDTSAATLITVNTLPVAAIAPSGPTSFCEGGNVVLDAGAITGHAFQWQLNGIDIPGATNSTYTVIAGGDFTVTVTNTTTNSCVATSAPVSVMVTDLPDANITPVGPTSACAGNGVTLDATTGTGFTWQWQMDGSDITGATSASYVATAAGNYTVNISAGGCDSLSPLVAVVIHPAPVPAITQTGNTLETGVYASYQWYLGGVAIAGATNQSLTMAAGGIYAVEVTDANSCTGISADFTGTVGIEDPEVDDIHIYPNPTTGIVFITAEKGLLEATTRITDMAGRTLMDNANRTVIDMGALPAGVYMLRYKNLRGVERITKIIRK